MLIKKMASLRAFIWVKNCCLSLLLLVGAGFNPLQAITLTEPTTITYYLYIADFAKSLIEIPTSNLAEDSSTIASSYLAGGAPIYNENNQKIGTCSASFLSMQNEDGIYTDIANYLSAADGLIVTWFTPTKLLNLELDSIINSMVTECSVVATTKVGFAPLFGQNFDLIVSSEGGKIYFQFSRTETIF